MNVFLIFYVVSRDFNKMNIFEVTAIFEKNREYLIETLLGACAYLGVCLCEKLLKGPLVEKTMLGHLGHLFYLFIFVITKFEISKLL